MKKPTSNLVRYRHCRNHLHCKSLDQLQKKACISLCTIHGAPEARRAFCRSTVVLTQTDDKKNPQFVGSSVKAELKAMLHRTIFCIFRENVTPSSGTSPLASYKKVPRPSEFLRRQVSVLKKKTDIARLGNKDELTQNLIFVSQ